jgi:phosphonatase-like hydrolase
MDTELIVFDMAGTTVNDGKTVYKAVQNALKRAGYEYDLQTVMNQIGGINKYAGIKELVSMKDSDFEDEIINRVHDNFLRIVDQSYKTDPDLKEIEGTSELFGWLKKRSIKIGLDTGYHRKTADILIDRMGWEKDGFIDCSVTSDEVPEGRPAPFMIHQIMAETGVKDPEKIIKIGDTVSDIREGRNAKCGKVISIYSGTQSAEILKKEKPDNLIYKLKELYPILEKG